MFRGKLHTEDGHYIRDVGYNIYTTIDKTSFGTLYDIDHAILRGQQDYELELADGRRIKIYITDILGATFRVKH
jgi:hypothetical protein